MAVPVLYDYYSESSKAASEHLRRSGVADAHIDVAEIRDDVSRKFSKYSARFETSQATRGVAAE
ncbi:MAG: hypothetical protein ACJ8FZ_01795 [Bradyrhizobium sp.]